jgi:ATP-dependent RNA helicase DeaD
MIPTLADALAERGYDNLTDVQQAVSDPEIASRDLLVSAQTGSGKTVAFGLAIAPTLLDQDGMFGAAEAPLALVVAPTRELAMQVKRELSWLFAKAGVRMASCVGGMDSREERRALERGAHIVVGTPGRLRDHITRGALSLDALRAVVLDEADEMLDMGFREDLEFMLAEAPEDRRTLMFSATVPPMIARMAQEFQRDAARISTVRSGDQHADISYQAMTVAHTEVENAIINLLRYHDARNAIVFANTRAGVSRLMARFANRGFSVVSLSGELSQTERTHALQAMRDGRARVCVATDVAARGIDLPNLELVIHADLPTGSEALLHRSGRTGRAGRKGVSALIATPKTVKKAERLLKWAKVKAEWVSPPSAEEILQKDQERLLSDPMWQDTATEQETAFGQTLLEQFPPEQIAVAFWRLFQSRQSAPEELSAPDAKPARRSHEDFGPSTWFSLSVGRVNQAEPRWLLPMLLRNARLDKNAIGAIRVQRAETFVEVSNASVDGLVAVLDKGGELEDGIRLRQLDGPPDLSQPQGDAAPRPRPERPKAAPRDDSPAPSKPAPKKRVWQDTPSEDQPAKGKGPKRDGKPFERKPSKDGKPRSFDKPRPSGEGKPKRHDEAALRPARPKTAERDGDAPRKPRHPKGAKPGGKPMGKPAGGKPASGPKGGKPGGKPLGAPKGGKPGGKPFGKPKGKRPLGANDAPRRK